MGKKWKDLIDGYEELLSEEVEELSKYAEFFKLHLNNIFSVISKVDFDEMEDDDEII